jgi:putative methionine-R-sulfoxide reductase with GAF domain
MKSVVNKLGYVFIFFFISAIFLTGFYLFNLPDEINKKALGAVSVNVKLVEEHVETLSYFFLISTFIGLAAIVFLLLGRNTGHENVVYVETYKNNEEEKQERNEHSDLNSIYNEKLEEIKSIIEQDANEKLVLNRVLSKLCLGLDASQGAIFKAIFEEEKRFIELWATFAYSVPDSLKVRFEFGEGLAGQVAKTGKLLNLKNVPQGYIKVLSGLGSSSPSHLVIIPLQDDGKCLGVMEIASFVEFTVAEEEFLKGVASLLAKKIASAEIEIVHQDQN